MPQTKAALIDIYERLSRHYGPTDWWPGDTPFEIAVGAILTQNTNWKNVERAIANLKRERLLGPKKILACEDAVLEAALRPSGYFRVKTRRLRNFCRYLVERYRGSMKRLAAQPLDVLRAELLAVNGIGPETADDILLYACDKPVFVVDAYTRRIFSRHGLCAPDIAYEPLRALFERNLEADLHLYKEYHGLIVFVGKDFCRRTPKCAECPLGVLLEQHPT
ncbi:MAG: endonuclease III domain-containing protein [Candidatus Hydrogenedentales bacterium]|jgi:endonuclease-3 related protein